MSLGLPHKSIVTLNLFEGPWTGVAARAVVTVNAGPWMLKQVQHDEKWGA